MIGSLVSFKIHLISSDTFDPVTMKSLGIVISSNSRMFRDEYQVFLDDS